MGNITKQLIAEERAVLERAVDRALVAFRRHRSYAEHLMRQDCIRVGKEPCECSNLPCKYRLRREAGTHRGTPLALVHADAKTFPLKTRSDSGNVTQTIGLLCLDLLIMIISTKFILFFCH